MDPAHAANVDHGDGFVVPDTERALAALAAAGNVAFEEDDSDADSKDDEQNGREQQEQMQVQSLPGY